MYLNEFKIKSDCLYSVDLFDTDIAIMYEQKP